MDDLKKHYDQHVGRFSTLTSLIQHLATIPGIDFFKAAKEAGIDTTKGNVRTNVVRSINQNAFRKGHKKGMLFLLIGIGIDGCR